MEVTLESFKKRFTYDPQKDLLGKGGHSEVYKAYDTEDKIFVALKIYQGDLDSKYNLSNEIRKFKRLRHPNVIEHLETYDVITGNNDIHGNPIKYQIGILEYADGGTLADLIKTSALTGIENSDKLEELAKGISAGLEYLHSKNIIHRDLKPSNILLFIEENKRVPKISDFVIAKIMDNTTAVSTQLVGTIEYMAPEYFRTELGEITFASDLWSLGVILYEAATGTHPFGKTSLAFTNGQIINNILNKKLSLSNHDFYSGKFIVFINACLRIEKDLSSLGKDDKNVDVEINPKKTIVSDIIESEEKNIKINNLKLDQKKKTFNRSSLKNLSLNSKKNTIKRVFIGVVLLFIALFSIHFFKNYAFIGQNIWTRNNLNVDHFRNGDEIWEAKTNAEWLRASEEGISAWCYYNNDPSNSKKYGKLYNWYAVNDVRGLAPLGWHIPSQEEIRQIESETNSLFGFWNDLGGYRLSTGSFKKSDITYCWWSSNSRNSQWADILDIVGYDQNSVSISTTISLKGWGFPIRTVRD